MAFIQSAGESHCKFEVQKRVSVQWSRTDLCPEIRWVTVLTYRSDIGSGSHIWRWLRRIWHRVSFVKGASQENQNRNIYISIRCNTTTQNLHNLYIMPSKTPATKKQYEMCIIFQYWQITCALEWLKLIFLLYASNLKNQHPSLHEIVVSPSFKIPVSFFHPPSSLAVRKLPEL